MLKSDLYSAIKSEDSEASLFSGSAAPLANYDKPMAHSRNRRRKLSP